MIEIPYVNVPNDLSKVKTKLAFNLTKRQLVCFGIAAAVGVPTYLLARSTIGNTDGKMYDTIVLNMKSVMEICRLSRA